MMNPTVQTLSLGESRKRLQAARELRDPRQISEAAARLAFFLFQKKKFNEGVPLFEEAVATARKTGDEQLLVYCLQLKAQAYQAAGRLPDAYQAAREIAEIATKSGDQALLSDALASQGMILLDSGEPVIARERLQQAYQIANELSDSRRQMQLLGALGNYSLSVAALELAQNYFEEASLLARLNGNQEAETGYLGNEAAVLVWQGRHREALPLFMKVLAFAESRRDPIAKIHALRFLAQIYQALREDEQFDRAANAGLDLAREHDARAALAFLEMLIPAAYRRQQVEQGDRLTAEAIELAHRAKDRTKEYEFLVSLGESYLAHGKAEAALEIYPRARQAAGKLERSNDAAYLTGRIGVALADLGRLPEAKASHLQAYEEARRLDLGALEGEQLSMLAIACREEGDLQQAVDYCRQAVVVFGRLDLDDQKASAQDLLAELISAEAGAADPVFS